MARNWKKLSRNLHFQEKMKKTERVQALTDLIMEKFDQDSMVFYQWAVKIHEEVIESIPETVELEKQMSQFEITERQRQRTVTKVLEWDPGNYLRLLNEC